MKIQNNIVISQEVIKKINEGGVTYCPLSGKDYGGTQCIAISPFPERSRVFEGNATSKMLADFCDDNSDLLSEGFSVGGWLNASNGKTYLDVSVPISLEKETEAICLGKKANQIAGFNLSNFSDVPIGGTGEFNSLVSPFDDRLEDALMLMTN